MTKDGIAKAKGLLGQGVILILWGVVPLTLIKLGPSLFGWSEIIAFAIGLGYLIILICAFFCWPSRGHKVIEEVEDPILGLVTRASWGWSATLDYPTPDMDDYDDYVTISGGDALEPTVIQLATFVEIKDGWEQWMEKLNEALDKHPAKVVSALPRDVYLGDIKLDADELAWRLEFFIIRKNVDVELDLDLVANFRDGKLIDVQLLPD